MGRAYWNYGRKGNWWQGKVINGVKIEATGDILVTLDSRNQELNQILLPNKILSKDPIDILNYVESEFGLSKLIVDITIFTNVDLNIIEFVELSKGYLFKRNKNMIERMVQEIKGHESLVSEFGIKNYLDELMDTRNGIRSIDLSNFIIRKDKNLIATKDFRVVIKDHKGSIPESVMLNISSVAYMLIGGLIDYQVAYAYIVDRMRDYGVPYLEFKSSGYLAIDLYTNKKDLRYKSKLRLSKSSGSKY